METTNTHCSHLVHFRSLQEQGEERNNAVCLDKLLMSSSDMVIVTDTCRLQLDTTDDLEKFAFHFDTGWEIIQTFEGFLS